MYRWWGSHMRRQVTHLSASQDHSMHNVNVAAAKNTQKPLTDSRCSRPTRSVEVGGGGSGEAFRGY